MSENPSALPPGTRLAHFEVREVLGSGGMGTVYLAHDLSLDRSVALKVLRPEIAGDPSLVDRFVLEARAAARVSHPNLTHVYFVGNEEGRPFFAMEHCPGATLEWAVKERGPFPLDRGLDVLIQAARGLAAAHGAGVVHRDVKPGNLMLLPDGMVKVTDFGLAKSLKGDVGLTGGRLVGTPTYMTPEQIRGKPVDARTDIYLLGLTGYLLFTGRPAFGSDQVGEVINDQMNTPLPSVYAARGELPSALDDVLRRMCAKDPAKRPAGMEEVIRLLDEVRPRPITPAPILGRVAATALDLVLVLMAWGGLCFMAWWGGRFLGLDLMKSRSGPGDEVVLKLPEMVQNALLLFCAGTLTLGLEWAIGTTPGKTAFHFAVTREDGAPAGWRAILGRFLLKYPGIAICFVPENWSVVVGVVTAVQALAFGGGAIFYFFADARTLSDRLTRTRVVVRAPRPWSLTSLTRGRRSA
jgi:serine/threonine-protein kinase